ncbi:hypothetical protein [Chitinophaga sp. Cy-1792]|uniref:hypothetical protein n=1 Tax=Chitinophaga sp. Cy-1792 TaxID=2608339 RepID=UPI0014220E66|nr:hypothetical protein [Chitinophaga sp. Cy-1792]NIG53621.1 hypothetical protein [Chitinophaga sp. Cy-1792]
MKFSLLVAALVVLSTNLFAQRFTITCNFSGFEERDKFLVRRFPDLADYPEAYMIKGSATFQGRMSSGPELLEIYSEKDKSFRCLIFVGNENIVVTANRQSPAQAIVNGSQYNAEWLNYRKAMQAATKERDSIDMLFIKANEKKLNAGELAPFHTAHVKAWEKVEAMERAYVATHLDSYIALEIMYEKMSEDGAADWGKELFKRVKAPYRDSYYGQEIAKYIANPSTGHPIDPGSF